jgi:G:T-mismatch repair DNA endonuclease (very short patch repair protein)
MKNQTFTPTDNLITTLYNEFIADEGIISISALRRKHGYGSKSGQKVQSAIYDKYGMENVKKISLSRCSKHRRSKITGTYRPTEKTLKKRAEAIKRSYIDNPNLIEIRRQNAYKTIAGRVQSEEEKLTRANSLRGKKRSKETKLRMSLAKKGKPLSDEHRKSLCVPKSVIPTPYIRSKETRKKISKNTKKQWEDGVHTPTYRSKGQIEMESVIKSLGYDVVPEFFIEGRPYDTFVVDKNLLIEYNGTFWHRDPRFFPKEMTHKGNCLLTEKTEDVWERDKQKINLARDNGYDIIVVWEHDWKNCKDKTTYIKNILK